ncbi:MAG: hypothetical protein DCC55_07450 [Chloroflexi bacterium]|nr:MAG: hypothetical protein DCC55_07450 [Chloroflexota bacterium]
MPAFPFTEVDYREYINSPQWHWKAELAKSHVGNRCQICNRPASEVELETYHRTYDRLGNELLEDLIVLCRRCHKQFKKGKLPSGLPLVPSTAAPDPYTLLNTTTAPVGHGGPTGNNQSVLLALGGVGLVLVIGAVLVATRFQLGPPVPPTSGTTQARSPTLPASAPGVLVEGPTATPTFTRAPPTPSSTSTPTATQSPTPTPSPTPSPTSTPPPTPSPTIEPTPTEPARYYYLRQDANIRRGPGTRYPAVRVGKAGEVLDVIGCDTPCEWYELADGNWVREYLVVEASVSPPTEE